MIALLTGEIVSKSPAAVILDVRGVGYQVSTTLTTLDSLPEIGKEIKLYIYTHVREDIFALYGFMNLDEKDIFVRLLKVNGIGPKLALSILSGVPPSDFVSAVLSEDMARLNAIPGVGKKTAERIVIDLKDKLKDVGVVSLPAITGSAKSGAVYEDALSALTNLGYNKNDSEKVLSKIGVKKGTPLTNVIKDALKELSQR